MSVESSKPRPIRAFAWIVAFVAFAVGLPVGWLVVAVGSHGSSPWPTVIFSAPVCFVGTLIFGDSVGYLYTMIVGTAVLFGLVAYQIARRNWKTLAALLAVHIVCAAGLAAMILAM